MPAILVVCATMRTSLPATKMSSIIREILLIGAVLCQAATAQTPTTTPHQVDLKTAKTPTGTFYLDGKRPLVKESAKGLTGYVYEHGRITLAVRADGRFAAYKYLNGKLDRVEYSDGAVRRIGAKVVPSAGGSIAARGGVSPMLYDDDWYDDLFLEHPEIIDPFGPDKYGRDWSGFDGRNDFPSGAHPEGPFERAKCLYDAFRTLEVSFKEVCPILNDHPVCIKNAMQLYDEATAFCLS